MRINAFARRLLSAALLSCVSIAPAHAGVRCWNETQAAAATVRNLQNRLLVAAQLCAANQIDIIPVYNQFVRANLATLQGANSVLRAQFASAFGSEGEHHYDAFVTAQFNGFGGSAADEATCRAFEAATAEGVAVAGEVEALIALADRVTDRADMPGGRCRITFLASAETARR